jgi:hypothetical protein
LPIRLKGLLHFLGFGAVVAVALWWLIAQRVDRPGVISSGWSPWLYVLMVPGGIALAGLVQFVSGVPFSQLSERWDGLKGWQRGIFGVLIFLAAIALLVGGFAVYVLVTSG